MTVLAIPRCYHDPCKEKLTLQLHGFCDSSQVALAAVVYLRTVYVDTSVSTSMVIAKSRVAPMKTQTIPKLESCSAVLLSKLLTTVKEQNINFQHIHAWSDSTIALGWINSSPHRLKTYVANRVVAITEKIPACYWRRVASTDNPADLGSRGTTAGALIQSSLWWKGPSWLQQSPDHWPVKNLQDQVLLPEVRSVAFVLEMKPPAEDLSLRYSSFSKCINVISWICRFCSNTTKSQAERIWSSQLTVQENNAAELLLFKQQQAQFFSKE